MGYYGEVQKKPEPKPEKIAETIKQVVEPEGGAIPKDKPEEDTKIVEQDLYFCKFCDKFFETLKGKEVHESRWCKEKK